jgi:hypothetical protein
VGIVSIGNGLWARTREGGPRRRPALDRAEPKRGGNGKFTKKTNDEKGGKR